MIKDILNNLENNFGKGQKKDNQIMINNLGLQKLLNKDLFYGKIIEIYGDAASGKSTFLYHLLGELNRLTLFIDTEFQFDNKFIERYTDLNNLISCQANNSEIILDIIKKCVYINYINIICIDSFTSINLEDSLSFFKEVENIIKNSKILVIMTNQLRHNFRLRKAVAYGSKKQKNNYWIRLKTKKYKYNDKFYILVHNKDIKSEDYTLEIK